MASSATGRTFGDWRALEGFISFDEARASQARQLGALVPRIRTQLEDLGRDDRLTGPLVMMGIGASHAAAYPALWALRSRRIESWLLDPGEMPVPLSIGDSRFLAISQGGRSAETLRVTESVEPSRRMGLVNTVPSPLSEMVEILIDLGSIDDSYASTTGYTGTIVSLAMLAEAWDRGRISEQWLHIEELVRQVQLATTGAATDAGQMIAETAGVDLIAFAPSYGTAEAGALLLREVARIPSSSMNTRQYLHGAMESAGTVAHIVFGEERELELARTLVSAGQEVVFVGEGKSALPGANLINLPRVGSAMRAVLEGVVMQEIARAAAVHRGIEIEEFVFENNDTKQPVSK